MTDEKKQSELTEEELKEQDCEPLPDREVMSLIDPTTSTGRFADAVPLDGGTTETPTEGKLPPLPQ